MHEQQDGLRIRGSQRHEVALDAWLWIAPDHEDRVRFGRNAGARDGRIDVTVLDISRGGSGILTTVFLPVGCKVTLRVLDPLDLKGEPLMETPGKVMRVQMVDRRPGYLVGLSYDGGTPTLSERARGLLREVFDVCEIGQAREEGSDGA